MSTVRWQRLEGFLVFLAAALWLWGRGPDWPIWLLVVLALAPDFSIAGYSLGPRYGATLYNGAHLYAGGALLAGFGHAFGLSSVWTNLGLIWMAHVGFDRAFGYGLKEPSAFTDTHLSRIGKSP